jgi:hypothetical protein
MVLRKFLAAQGRGPFSGHAWPLPTRNGPGEWVAVEGALAQCARGLHVCRDVDLAHWIHDELWEVEVDGEAIEGVDCLVVPRARLVRRMDAWAEGSRRFAQACIEHAASEIGPRATRSLPELLDDGRSMLTDGFVALTAYTAAVAVGRLTLDDPTTGFRRERAWQSAWIAEHVR